MNQQTPNVGESISASRESIFAFATGLESQAKQLRAKADTLEQLAKYNRNSAQQLVVGGGNGSGTASTAAASTASPQTGKRRGRPPGSGKAVATKGKAKGKKDGVRHRQENTMTLREAVLKVVNDAAPNKLRLTDIVSATRKLYNTNAGDTFINMVYSALNKLTKEEKVLTKEKEGRNLLFSKKAA